MGLTSACYIMQRITLAFRYMHNMFGFYLCNYVDDLVGSEKEYDTAVDAYNTLGVMFDYLGVQESPEKAVPPTTEMEFLGNLLNSVHMMISVTPDRLQELERELEEWSVTINVTRRQLESIIGKLQFVCNCIRAGRLFLNRLLNFLRGTIRGRQYTMPLQAKKDIEWWRKALEKFPGTSLMWFESFEIPDAIIATDSSLQGAGGVCGKQFYRIKYPLTFAQGCSIVHLELWALIIGIKIWLEQLKNKKVVVHCDNQAVAQLINSGRARDQILQQGLREVCYLAAVGEFEILAQFIPGVDNRLPDFLSRWSMGNQFRTAFRAAAPGFTRRPVRGSLLHYSHTW